jgi:outer membrane protein assembly factor BamB
MNSLKVPPMFRLLILCTMTFSYSFVAKADWTAFLGGGNRIDAQSFSPPIEWSPKQAIAWQVPLPGHGQSSPIIAGGYVYITATEGPMKETNIVACHDLQTGQEKWRESFPSSLQVKNDVYTSRAAPTPVADESGVIAFFESGNLIALTTNGQIRWQRDLIADYGKFEGRFGLGGSLAQTSDKVFVLADNDGPAYLASFDKQTGQTVWKTDRESRIAWSSPMIVSVDGEKQVVVSSSGSVDGYAADTGKLLWTFDDVGGNTVASPIPVDGGKFLIGASPGRNGENTEGAKQSNLLMQIVRTRTGFEPKVVWRNTQATSSFGSPMIHEGYAYYTNRAGVVYCIDAETGDTAYNARLAESNWATPIGIGKRVYFFGKDGTTTVLQSGPEKKVLAENRLWESAAGGGRGGFGGEIQYGVAPTPRGFVVRTGSRLFLVGSF